MDHSSYLADRLPFATDDYDAARDAFAQWRRSGSRADRGVVEVWAYGYVVTYFHDQFARARKLWTSDGDQAVTRVVLGVLRSLDGVREPGQFPNYVSKACRNELASLFKRRRHTVQVTDWLQVEGPDESSGYDLALIRHLVARRVDRMPPALRVVARLRFLEQAPYDEIARATGRPVDTVRTYAAKAVALLRCDPALLDLRGED